MIKTPQHTWRHVDSDGVSRVRIAFHIPDGWITVRVGQPCSPAHVFKAEGFARREQMAAFVAALGPLVDLTFGPLIGMAAVSDRIAEILQAFPG